MGLWLGNVGGHKWVMSGAGVLWGARQNVVHSVFLMLFPTLRS